MWNNHKTSCSRLHTQRARLKILSRPDWDLETRNIYLFSFFFSRCILFIVFTSVFLPCCCCSSAFTLRLTWGWHWHTLCRLWCFLFILWWKQQKIHLKPQTTTEPVTTCVCVCVPNLGGVQTPSTNILNLSLKHSSTQSTDFKYNNQATFPHKNTVYRRYDNLPSNMCPPREQTPRDANMCVCWLTKIHSSSWAPCLKACPPHAVAQHGGTLWLRDKLVRGGERGWAQTCLCRCLWQMRF